MKLLWWRNPLKKIDETGDFVTLQFSVLTRPTLLICQGAPRLGQWPDTFVSGRGGGTTIYLCSAGLASGWPSVEKHLQRL